LHFVKRFLVDVRSDKKVSFISESEGSRLEVVTTAFKPEVVISFNKRLKETKDLADKKIKLDKFIGCKRNENSWYSLTKFK
jgi:topoisomerase-4 subunit A